MKYTGRDKWSLIEIQKFFKLRKSNEFGFLSLYFIFFLTLLTGFVFSFGFLFYASQSKDIFRTSCVTTAVDLQKKLIQAEKKLFLLNAPSTALRLQRTATLAALAATPPPYNAPLLVELKVIETAQIRLDAYQKKLILSAQTMATAEYDALIVSANKNNYSLKNKWSAYLNIFSHISPAHSPIFSVRPDSIGGIAPNYELEHDYNAQQRLELIWQNWFTISENIQKNFNPKNFLNQPLTVRYGLNCRIEPERTNTAWDLKINVDRF